MANNWQNYIVTHEQLVAMVYCADPNYSFSEAKNLHIIHSNEAIYNGFSTVNRGDIIKGYLIDWRGASEFSYFKINTALKITEASEAHYNTSVTNLCMHFFATELYVNGYLFIQNNKLHYICFFSLFERPILFFLTIHTQYD